MMNILKQHRTFQGLTCFAEHQSSVTKTKMNFSYFLPEGNKNEIEHCLIWLSGLTCNQENFITKAGAQIHLNNTKMMVVCPDTSPRGLNLPGEHDSYDFGSGAGFYVDATTPGYRDHYLMDSYITKELVSLLKHEFSPSSFSISGHSMGGHGALVLGLRNPELFQSISAFSPIVHPSACSWGQKALQGYLGEERSKWLSYDATELIKAGHKAASSIFIDQGLSDEFLQEQLLSEDFVRACQDASQPLELRYHEGFDHSYYFIQSFIADHIKFHLETLSHSIKR
jgi:S-formylglutathione hydrolase